jgi:hypothetical protein
VIAMYPPVQLKALKDLAHMPIFFEELKIVIFEELKIVTGMDKLDVKN